MDTRDNSSHEKDIITKASWKMILFFSIFLLIHFVLRLDLLSNLKMAILILLTLVGLASIVLLFKDFHKGMKMGLSEKVGKKVTIIVWLSIPMILILIVIQWYIFFLA